MKNHTRREFLEKTVCGMGAGAVFSAFAPELLAAAPMAADKRSYTAARWVVELEGALAGPAESVQGGNIIEQGGNVNKPGGVQKHPTNVKYEDIMLACGTGMSKSFYEWVGSVFSGRNSRKNGAISSCDDNYKETNRTEWNNGIISEVRFPGLDASSKEAARMTIRISPEGIRWVKGSGRDLRTEIGRKQKAWEASNFRLEIPGVDCKRVSKIDALTVQENGSRHSFSNLVVTLPEADTSTWVAWERSHSEGKSAQGGGKTGRLEYLGPDVREVLFSLTFHNLELGRLTTNATRRGSSVGGAKAEMNFQGVIFSYANAA